MRFCVVWALCVVLTLLTHSSCRAQASPTAAPSATPSAVDIARDRLDTMLRTGYADPTWFSASFLAQVPASKVDDVIATMKSALGTYRSLEFTPANFIAHFSKGSDDILIHLDADYKINGLFFKPPNFEKSS